ncbi:Uncharacterized protein TPAR_08272 [Tolypocladium paradoxum]|uniref:Uncharacterized protein n=1 Tax=Tolypocladium paradoxum TaxID=94208 RepID=A0A2S4KMU6_9HYPO|nr:Uncharacterized protein TPAR_08272 [Tolypocladium paradoxum]
MYCRNHSRNLYTLQASSFPNDWQRSERPDQLAAEVKGIYAGLVMVESKCIEYDSAERKAIQPTTHGNSADDDIPYCSPPTGRSSRASRFLPGKTAPVCVPCAGRRQPFSHSRSSWFLLGNSTPGCECYLAAPCSKVCHACADVASWHSLISACDAALRRLASRYAMPARMWRHTPKGQPPTPQRQRSIEHMLTFIYVAYRMMALLYETVPYFEDTWIECLGDFGRYRMAIEDDDIGDREVWTGVSQYWYTKAWPAPSTFGLR